LPLAPDTQRSKSLGRKSLKPREHTHSMGTKMKPPVLPTGGFAWSAKPGLCPGAPLARRRMALIAHLISYRIPGRL